MRKALVLAALAGLLLATAASAAQVDVVLYPDFNMIAAPCVPFDPIPANCFKDSTAADIYIDMSLTRFDPVTQSYVIYDQFAPEGYGNVLLGDGAWLNMQGMTPGSSVTWRYQGVPDGVPSDPSDATTQTDMWISLPVAGFTLVGHPFNHSVDIANIKITDGTQTVDLATARDTLSWTDATFMVFNAQTQSYEDCGIDPWNTRSQLEAGHAYWLTTTRDNLALIIPAN